jgi:hypothetical protein
VFICYFEYQLKAKPFVSSYAAKKYFLEQQLDSVEVIILGSSQTFNGVNPACFAKKTFNLANVSQTLYYDKRLALKYLPKLPKLNTVVINIGYFSFFYQLYDIKENWRDYYYNQHFGIKYYELNQFLLANYSAFSVYQPMHSAKLALNNFEDETTKEILPNGYQPKYIQEAINDSLGKERVDVHNTENYKNRRKEIEKDLEDFVKQLSEKNIQVVFLTTPVFSTYSKFCDKKVIEANNQFINLLCRKYNYNYLNFFEDKRFNKDDFFDNDHLKNNGAIKLSKIIKDTLIKL